MRRGEDIFALANYGWIFPHQSCCPKIAAFDDGFFWNRPLRRDCETAALVKNTTSVYGNLGVNLVDGVAVPGIKLVWLNHYGIEFPIRRVCPKFRVMGGIRAWGRNAAVDFLTGAPTCC